MCLMARRARAISATGRLYRRWRTDIARCPPTRGSHSSTFRLNVSNFCGICWVVSVC